MAFTDFPEQEHGVQLLQRSLERGRLAHGYLFTGHQLTELESIAYTLAKTLNCQQPIKTGGVAIDCCDKCLSCKKITDGNHADVHWVRPESKSRVITTDQMRDLMKEIQLKPTEAAYKVAVLVAADRLRVEAANAFLKTLEEPPAKTILILLTTDQRRVLETILSRCLRLNFAGDGPRPLDASQMEWLGAFGTMAAAPENSLLGRYRLMDVLLRKLNELKEGIESVLTTQSPLQRYKDVEKDLQEKWEEELKAAIESEYRRQRADLLSILQWWFRDICLQTLCARAEGPEPTGKGQVSKDALLNFPELPTTSTVAQRLSTKQALENLQVLEQLQRWLHTNVQEALALEVGLLKLQL